ncbi:MAG: DUF1361 domain-containing protein [Acidimicrobiia bacterium]|nr:DUF1361 domain-containing protein [Acidimicrobiia bacterium]
MRVLLGNGPWMVWNSLLACIPLAFAVFLFTGPRTTRRPPWWVGLAIFVAFLPNGPYVITDLIHLNRDNAARALRSDGVRHAVAWRESLLLILPRSVSRRQLSRGRTRSRSLRSWRGRRSVRRRRTRPASSCRPASRGSLLRRRPRTTQGARATPL